MKFSIPTHMTSDPNGHILSPRWPYLENDKARVFSRVIRVYLSNDKDQNIYQFVAFLAKKMALTNLG